VCAHPPAAAELPQRPACEHFIKKMSFVSAMNTVAQPKVADGERCAACCAAKVHVHETGGANSATDPAPPIPVGTCPALAASRAVDSPGDADTAIRQARAETATCLDQGYTPAPRVTGFFQACGSAINWDVIPYVYLIGMLVFTVFISQFVLSSLTESYLDKVTLAATRADLDACRAEQAAHAEAPAQGVLAIAGALRGVAAAAGV